MTSGHPRSADVATLIDRYDAALNAHDLDAVASMHDDAIVFHNHGQRARRGATAGRAHIGAIVARWPARRLRGEEWTARAVHPDDGRQLEWDGVDIFPLTSDGRSRNHVYSSCATPRVSSPGARALALLARTSERAVRSGRLAWMATAANRAER
jgi:hypothetical protein